MSAETDETLLLQAWGIVREPRSISYPSAGAAQRVRDVLRRVLERYAPQPGNTGSGPPEPGNTGITGP